MIGEKEMITYVRAIGEERVSAGSDARPSMLGSETAHEAIFSDFVTSKEDPRALNVNSGRTA